MTPQKVSSGQTLLALLTVSSFFMPYLYGGFFRLDHGIAIFSLLCVGCRLVVNGRISIPDELRLFLLLSFASAVYAALSLIATSSNLYLAGQYAVQYAYLVFGATLFLVVGSTLQRAVRTTILTLAITAIALNALAALQIFAPDAELVFQLLSLYGGRESDPGTYGSYTTKAAEVLLGGGQAISIFTGMQGLAVFDLFFVAIALGALSDAFHTATKAAVLVALICAISGGLLTGSKTFIFGFVIFSSLLVLISLRSMGWVAIGLAMFGLFLSIARQHSYQVEDILTHVTNLEPHQLLASRFGEEGYLTEVMHIVFDPVTLLFGIGADAANYRYSDNQFRQIVLMGGIPLLFLYYSALIALLLVCWNKRNGSAYAKPLCALAVVYLIAGVGMDVHFQARTIVLWVLLTFVLVGTRVRPASRQVPKRQPTAPSMLRETHQS
jgi:hypothetical protein